MNEKLKKKITSEWFKILQDAICNDIEKIEGKKNIFRSKNWQRGKRGNEGGGEFRIFENGKIFDKVGVNYSKVYGKLSSQFKNKIPGTKKVQNFGRLGFQLLCI